MLNPINQMGPLGWIFVILAVAIVFKAIKSAVKLFGKGSDTKVDLNGMIYLAIVGLAVGVFSCLLGIFQGLQIFSQLSSAQVAAGFAQSLLAPLVALFIFILTTVFWLLLRWKMRKVQSL